MENPKLTPAMKAIFSQLCGKEDDRDGFDDFEMEATNDDNDNVSHTSSCLNQNKIYTGQLGLKDIDGTDNKDDTDKPPSGELECELFNKTEQRRVISGDLKMLGNAKKRAMYPLILKDMLGVNGDLTLKDVKEKRDKILKKEKRKIDMLYLAVNHFD